MGVALVEGANGGLHTNYAGKVEAAIKAAKAGQTIKLVRDITASQIITIDKAITLDGNGFKYSGNMKLGEKIAKSSSIIKLNSANESFTCRNP